MDGGGIGSGPWEPLTAPVDLTPGTVDVVVAAGYDGPVDGFERDRAARLTEAGRKLSRRARHQASARGALARLLGLAPADVPLKRTDGGRPVLEGRDLAVSLSYADDVVLVAVSAPSATLLGVDVERRRPVDVASLTTLVCADSEAAALASSDRDVDRQHRLLRLWTVKEAVLKAGGAGLTVDPRSVVSDLVDQGRLRSVPPGLGRATRWRLVEVDPSRDHVATLALRVGGAREPTRVRCWVL